VLPVVLDVGTNNQGLIDDEHYLGTRQVSVREKRKREKEEKERERREREREAMRVCEKERERGSMCV